MLRFAADENLNNDILRGLLRRSPKLNIVRVQDTPLAGSRDEVLLEWLGAEDRILLTHDVTTITKHAHNRIRQGRPAPGVFAVPRSAPIGIVIDDVLLIDECSDQTDWQGQIHYLPLQ